MKIGTKTKDGKFGNESMFSTIVFGVIYEQKKFQLVITKNQQKNVFDINSKQYFKKGRISIEDSKLTDGQF